MDYSKYIYKTAGCPALGDWAIRNKLKVPWGKAKRGDIVLFDFNRNGTSDHVGIVTGVGSGYVDTIEGNTGGGSNTNGDGVCRRRRYRSQVNYFVRTKCPDIEAVIRRAEAELGYKEGRNNNNKYGKWFGANHQPWCCQFVVYCFAHAKEKAKPVAAITKPAGKYTGTIPAPTIKKGSKGSKVKDLQKFLNWYGSFKLVIDGDCGVKTVRAMKVFQKTEGLTADGIYGAKSQAKAKVYKADSKPKPEISVKPAAASKTPKADKIVAKIKDLAWAYGTATKKYQYSTGAPKAAMKAAMAKYGYATKVKQSDCGYCVNTVVREAIGGSFKALAGVKEKFPEGSGFEIVFKGESIPGGLLKPGDIIRYKKTNGSQHTLFYYGDGKIAEGGRKIRFFVIKKDEGKYNRSNVRKSTIEVLRVKE